MKIIELSDRIVYCDDIIEIYVENNYSPTRYQLKTINGTYRITHEDYYKTREYLLSLNDTAEIIEEEKKIPEKINTKGYWDVSSLNDEEWSNSEIILVSKINEIIDKIDEMENK